MKRAIILISCFLSIFMAGATEERAIPIYRSFEFRSRTDLCNFYAMMPYLKSGSHVFDVKSNHLNGDSVNKEINLLKIYPAGLLYAVTYDEKKPRLLIYSSTEAGRIISRIKLETPLASFCYSPDAKYIVACQTDGKVLVYKTEDYSLLRTVENSFVADRMLMSDNGYYIAMLKGGVVEIRSFEEWTLRKRIAGAGEVTSVAFSKDGGYMAVTTSDGKLSLYDARTFELQREYEGMGEAICCDINRDGKYIAVATSGSEIIFQNRFNDNDRYTTSVPEGGIDKVEFVRSSIGVDFLAYHTPFTVGYTELVKLTPYYGSLISEEVGERMDEWMKQMSGETLEEYKLRINDESRKKQMSLYQQEIATRLAGGMMSEAVATIGGYNLETSVLTINFDSMPSVFLTIPENEVADFSNTGNLKFLNPQYVINDEDKFELVYVEVQNSVTGESYVFDNRERKSLEFLSIKEDFVPLELIQMSQMEEQKLEAIKESVVAAATETNTISNHTNINVSTHVDNDYNAEGKKIINYRVGVSYDVEAGYSEREDFGPGKYRPEESGAAQSMLNIIRKAFETDFAQYVKAGKKIRVSITGTADGTPIRNAIAYDESFGRFENQPVWSNGSLSNVTVTKAKGIEENKQLAFIRAAGMKKYIEDNIKGLTEMDSDFRYNVEVSDKKGSEYRRISVEFIFVDAF